MTHILQRVNLKGLKEYVSTNLPKKSLLRELILNEKEDLDVKEFVIKIDVWLKLLRRESSE